MKKWIYTVLVAMLFSACEKEIFLDLPPAPKELVVEAYINDFNQFLNYVIISETVDYMNPDLRLPAVSDAIVIVTEGTVSGQDTVWDQNAIQLREVLKDVLPGVYYSPFLEGQAGKVYRLNIEVGNKKVLGFTSIPNPVPIDSVHMKLKYEDDTTGLLTVFFFDPPKRGNNYRMMYKLGGDSVIGSWGSLTDGDVIRDDEFINGETWDFRYSREFELGDTIDYYLNSMDRSSYLFWDSYFSLRGNTGNPFATPVQLKSNLQGAIGCFSGFGVSYRRILVK